MEQPSSFDLNRAIQRWRENLNQSPAFRSENLNELESHLRDSIATLQTSGLSVEEAFMVAAKRIGKDGVLANEFSKVNGKAMWLDRVLWVLIGIQVWNWVGRVTATVASNAVFFGLSGVGYDVTTHGFAIPVTLLTLANLLTFAGGLGLCWWLIGRYRRALKTRAHKSLRTVGGTIAEIMFVLFLLGLTAPLVGRVRPFLPLKSSNMYMFDQCTEFSSALMMVLKAILLVGLTVFLARKQLRLSKA